MRVFNSLGSNYDSKFVLKSLWFSPPGSIKKLEEEIKFHYNNEQVVLTYKGREAIALGLKSLNLPIGSKVIVNGYTCYAVYDAVVSADLEPVYLDIDKETLNFTPEAVEKALKAHKDIKVVMVQNTLGNPVDIVKIEKLCKEHDVYLVEDLAHCVAMKYDDGREAGTVGVFAALSFSQDKYIDGVSGGALVINSDKIKVDTPTQPLSLKTKFIDRIYPISTVKIKFLYGIGIGKLMHKAMTKLHLLSKPMDGKPTPPRKLTKWHAKLIYYSIYQLPQNIEHRQKIAAIYAELPKSMLFDFSANATYIRFPVKVADKRNELIEFLKSQNIFVSDIWYDAPVSPRREMANTNYKGQCKNSEAVSDQMLNLPTHRGVSEDIAKQIVEAIKKWQA